MIFHPSPSKVNTLLDKDLAGRDLSGVSTFFFCKAKCRPWFFETGDCFFKGTASKMR